MLLQIHIKKGQSPPFVVQCYSYSHWIHGEPQVRAPTTVQKLVLMPEKDGEQHYDCVQQRISKYKALSSYPVAKMVPLCEPLVKQMLDHKQQQDFIRLWIKENEKCVV